MTSIVFDYADIRSRMLGDDKPARKKTELEQPARKKTELEQAWADFMLPPRISYVDLARSGNDLTAIRTFIPNETLRKWVDYPLHINQEKFQEALRELKLGWDE